MSQQRVQRRRIHLQANCWASTNRPRQCHRVVDGNDVDDDDDEATTRRPTECVTLTHYANIGTKRNWMHFLFAPRGVNAAHYVVFWLICWPCTVERAHISLTRLVTDNLIDLKIVWLDIRTLHYAWPPLLHKSTATHRRNNSAAPSSTIPHLPNGIDYTCVMWMWMCFGVYICSM